MDILPPFSKAAEDGSGAGLRLRIQQSGSAKEEEQNGGDISGNRKSAIEAVERQDRKHEEGDNQQKKEISDDPLSCYGRHN